MVRQGCPRLPGIRTAAKFGKRAVEAKRMLGEPWSATFQRECVDKAPDALASEDFGDAWEPGNRELGTEGDDVTSGASSNRTVAATPAAIEAQREQERRIAEARTEEERVQARKDTGVFRFMLTLSQDEKPLINAVLGSSPAVKLVELCKAEAERQNIKVT